MSKYRNYYKVEFNPTQLAEKIQSNGRYEYGYDPESGNGRLMFYKKGIWRPANRIDILIQEQLGRKTQNARIKETEAALARIVKQRPWMQWNKKRSLINCLSGMLDPKTLKVTPHNPRYYSTIQIPVRWNPEANSKKVDEFFRQVLPEDCMELIYMMIGYLALPVISAKKFFVLLGPKDSGKTTFLGLITSLFRAWNYTQISPEEFSENRFALALLENKLLAISDDLDSNPLKSVRIMKILSGGFQMIKVEKKFENPYQVPLYTKFLFACNIIPITPDKSSAWYVRICVIPFPNSIPEDIQNRNLIKELTQPKALEALFKSAVLGLHEFMKRKMNFPKPESSKAALEEYKRLNDNVKAFINECCRTGPECEIERKRLYENYKSWCGNSNSPAESRIMFYRLIREHVSCLGEKKRDGRYFTGIALKLESFDENDMTDGPCTNQDIKRVK